MINAASSTAAKQDATWWVRPGLGIVDGRLSIAERDGLRGIPVPPEFANLPPEDAALARESLRIQQMQFGARRTGRSTETGVLRQRIAQLNEQILGYERQIASNIEQQRLIQEELAGMRSLAEKGYAPAQSRLALAICEGQGVDRH